jgi:hypothetical protein
MELSVRIPIGVARCVQVVTSGHGYLWPQPADVVHHLDDASVVPGNDLRSLGSLSARFGEDQPEIKSISLRACPHMACHAGLPYLSRVQDEIRLLKSQ